MNNTNNAVGATRAQQWWFVSPVLVAVLGMLLTILIAAATSPQCLGGAAILASR